MVEEEKQETDKTIGVDYVMIKGRKVKWKPLFQDNEMINGITTEPRFVFGNFDKILKNNIFFSGEDNLIFPAGHYIMSVDIVNREAKPEMQVQSSLGITSLDHQYYETRRFNSR